MRGQTPKVAPQEKAKKPTGRACKRMKYNRRFVNVVTDGHYGQSPLLHQEIILSHYRNDHPLSPDGFACINFHFGISIAVYIDPVDESKVEYRYFVGDYCEHTEATNDPDNQY